MNSKFRPCETISTASVWFYRFVATVLPLMRIKHPDGGSTQYHLPGEALHAFVTVGRRAGHGIPWGPQGHSTVPTVPRFGTVCNTSRRPKEPERFHHGPPDGSSGAWIGRRRRQPLSRDALGTGLTLVSPRRYIDCA